MFESEILKARKRIISDNGRHLHIYSNDSGEANNMKLTIIEEKWSVSICYMTWKQHDSYGLFFRHVVSLTHGWITIVRITVVDFPLCLWIFKLLDTATDAEWGKEKRCQIHSLSARRWFNSYSFLIATSRAVDRTFLLSTSGVYKLPSLHLHWGIMLSIFNLWSDIETMNWNNDVLHWELHAV